MIKIHIIKVTYLISTKLQQDPTEYKILSISNGHYFLRVSSSAYHLFMYMYLIYVSINFKVSLFMILLMSIYINVYGNNIL